MKVVSVKQKEMDNENHQEFGHLDKYKTWGNITLIHFLTGHRQFRSYHTQLQDTEPYFTMLVGLLDQIIHTVDVRE